MISIGVGMLIAQSLLILEDAPIAEESTRVVAVQADSEIRLDVQKENTKVFGSDAQSNSALNRTTNSQDFAYKTSRCNTGEDDIGDALRCSIDYGILGTLECSDTSNSATPRGIWTKEIYGNSAQNNWQLSGASNCTTPAKQSQAPQLHELIEREFATLPIPPSPLAVQPVSGWTFVNVPTIVHTNADPQLLNTTLLGTSIEIEVTPTSFTWDFNDPHEPQLVTTTDPGAPYPNHTIEHLYTRTGKATITLSTSWSGRFRTADTNQWTPIVGSATTTSTAPNLEIRDATSRLIEDPLR